jgi:hypothetical protein
MTSIHSPGCTPYPVPVKNVPLTVPSLVLAAEKRTAKMPRVSRSATD